MHDNKIKGWYPGVKIRCKACHSFLKIDSQCEKRSNEYLEDFKHTNPAIPVDMFDVPEKEQEKVEKAVSNI